MFFYEPSPVLSWKMAGRYSCYLAAIKIRLTVSSLTILRDMTKWALQGLKHFLRNSEA